MVDNDIRSLLKVMLQECEPIHMATLPKKSLPSILSANNHIMSRAGFLLTCKAILSATNPIDMQPIFVDVALTKGPDIRLAAELGKTDHLGSCPLDWKLRSF